MTNMSEQFLALYVITLEESVVRIPPSQHKSIYELTLDSQGQP